MTSKMCISFGLGKYSLLDLVFTFRMASVPVIKALGYVFMLFLCLFRGQLLCYKTSTPQKGTHQGGLKYSSLWVWKIFGFRTRTTQNVNLGVELKLQQTNQGVSVKVEIRYIGNQEVRAASKLDKQAIKESERDRQTDGQMLLEPVFVYIFTNLFF